VENKKREKVAAGFLLSFSFVNSLGMFQKQHVHKIRFLPPNTPKCHQPSHYHSRYGHNIKSRLHQLFLVHCSFCCGFYLALHRHGHCVRRLLFFFRAKKDNCKECEFVCVSIILRKMSFLQIEGKISGQKDERCINFFYFLLRKNSPLR
jgi:hypothetical protein